MSYRNCTQSCPVRNAHVLPGLSSPPPRVDRRRATPEALNAVLPYAPATLAGAEDDRRAHVQASLYRSCGQGVRQLTGVLNNTAAGRAKSYTQAEVTRHLRTLEKSADAQYEKHFGWRRAK